jgi:hypothetical protein
VGVEQEEEDETMAMTVRMEVKPEEIIEAVKRMKNEDRKLFLEDLLASTSPEYLESIRQAREDYRAGRVKTHKEVFGR